MMEIKELRREGELRTARKRRILQFGEGNFLRAFFDWMISQSNLAGTTDISITIVTPRFKNSPIVDALNLQQGLYHVILEGIEQGKPKRRIDLVESVSEALSPGADAKSMSRYHQIILSDDLQIVVSNTTEAGIVYEEEDFTVDNPHSFPAKIANLLWHRWKHYGGNPHKGLLFLPCELIENNGEILREHVLRHIQRQNLGEGLVKWIEECCHFCDTLVDRIVPGIPSENIDSLKAEIGFDDNAMVNCEFYHLWIIGGSGYEKAKELLPLDKAGLNVKFLPSITEFREKKVKILNGSHTVMAALGLQMGCDTVFQAFTHPLLGKFIRKMVDNEVIPTIAENTQEVKTFAMEILERFLNPYIKHRLSSISLNSISKWEVRCWPMIWQNYQQSGQFPKLEMMGFAALLCLYAPGNAFIPNDEQKCIEAMQEMLAAPDKENAIKKLCASGCFKENFETMIPGFSKAAASSYALIQDLDIENAIKLLLK